ncbi:MAG TPA: hypothetical protein PLW86_15130 [Rhodocyclaceae bacterium]|nr:hypothetical protein [Rhodocyclaceae bacterium]
MRYLLGKQNHAARSAISTCQCFDLRPFHEVVFTFAVVALDNLLADLRANNLVAAVGRNDAYADQVDVIPVRVCGLFEFGCTAFKSGAHCGHLLVGKSRARRGGLQRLVLVKNRIPFRGYCAIALPLSMMCGCGLLHSRLMLSRSNSPGQPVSESDQTTKIGQYGGTARSHLFERDVDFASHLVAIPEFFQLVQPTFD